MKISIKTLKGTSFQIDVEPTDTVANVKKAIETVQGSHVYPATQQMLIYQGEVLNDGTTLEEQNVAENSFLVIMLTKNKATSGSSTTSGSPATTIQPAATVSQASLPVTANPAPNTNETVPLAAPAPTTAAPAPAPTTAAPAPDDISTADVYGQAASNLVAGNTLESTIQDLLDMGGGSWTRDMVVRALRAAYNNPTRAVDYLYSGIPESAEVPPPVSQLPASGQAVIPPPAQAPQAPTVPSSGPNSNPLDLFPQGLPTVGANANANAGNLDFLRNSQQFQALRAMVQANPQILQPMLQELGKHNPQLMRLIQEHQDDFLRLINEPVEGEAGNILGQLAEGMPQAVTITPEEREAIGRLEAMGFDPALVLEVFIACNRNEELAANYLLDHMHEFDE